MRVCVEGVGCGDGGGGGGSGRCARLWGTGRRRTAAGTGGPLIVPRSFVRGRDLKLLSAAVLVPSDAPVPVVGK